MAVVLNEAFFRSLGWTDKEDIRAAVQESRDKHDVLAMFINDYERKLAAQKKSYEEAIEVLKIIIVQRDAQIAALQAQGPTVSPTLAHEIMIGKTIPGLGEQR